MNLTVYIDANCTKALAKYAKLEKKSRNAIVREAIRDWLRQWPESVTAFEGAAGIEPFEKHRKALKAAHANPFV